MKTPTGSQLMDRVEAWVREIRTPADFLRFLEASHRLSTYSATNAFLIEAQRPGCVRLKGFTAWRLEDRSVRKGEKAIHIFVPGRSYRDPFGKKQPGFGIVPVFDVGQTVPLDGPEIHEEAPPLDEEILAWSPPPLPATRLELAAIHDLIRARARAEAA